MTATLLSLFGSSPIVSNGQFVPTSFGQGGVFSPEMFSALPGLLQNIPLNATEQSLTGSGLQAQAYQGAQQGQDILSQGAAALPALLQTDPTASIAAARRGFSQETLPAILEKAPGFSSSDLQREMVRAGTDLETNIAALKEQNLARVGQTVAGLPQYSQALGSNLVDRASEILGYGQLGREMLRDTSPAGDAFRVLTAIQALTGPGFSNFQQASGQSKSTGVLA